ncbi:FtsX-like permease family protein [bacterium]|nr:FtsX-like permease family protein [bacterium]
MVISPLHRKVLRDVRRLWAQVIAIALVLAAGVATMILGNGASESLRQTRDHYYEANRFADIFADLTRAPRGLVEEIRAIDGVLAVEGRIAKLGLLDMPEMVEPGTVQFISLPAAPDSGLNRLYLRQGRLPDPQAVDEAVISQDFAAAHHLAPGARLPVLMNGHRRDLVVTGIALSPEFIYAIGPGEMMPDPRRFGIVWVPLPGLEAAFDLRGAITSVVVKLAPGASADRVLDTLDKLTTPYGGGRAILRKDQLSNAFLDAELTQLAAMSRVLPPIFLAVAAMLVNMTLARLVDLEREQIGLMKALGYSSSALALHYVEFVVVIAVLGIACGIVAGSWLGAGLAQLYARFFAFPFLIFTRDLRVYGLAAGIALAAAVAGAVQSARNVAWLAPAVAMAPAAPAVYHRHRTGPAGWLSKSDVMILRHLTRWPFRSLTSMLGVSMAVALLVASLWSRGSIERMIDISFFRIERQDATVVFDAPASLGAAFAVERMPGVLAVEPFRAVAARIGNGPWSRRLSIMGKPAMPVLSRVLDPDLRPMALPEEGLILSEALAAALHVGRGDLVQVEVTEGTRPLAVLPVSGISIGYVGLSATMRLDALNSLMRESDKISGVNLALDPLQRDQFYAEAKTAPATQFVSVIALTLKRFRDTLAENITMMNAVYLSLAAIITVSVVYNFARISLSEQGRELASLRVLGFSRAEVAWVLFGELATLVLIAQPVGWLIGTAIGWAMTLAFSSDLYRVPFVLGPEVLAQASLVVLTASLLTGWAIRGRLDRLDMIEVLKTRE